MSFDGSPHYVYWLRDSDGTTVYIGSSSSVGSRLKNHSYKPWWRDVKTVRCEQFANREFARIAERQAIASEKPNLNIVGKQSNPSILGMELQKARARCNLSQTEAAKKLRCATTELGRWEQGERLPWLGVWGRCICCTRQMQTYS